MNNCFTFRECFVDLKFHLKKKNYGKFTMLSCRTWRMNASVLSHICTQVNSLHWLNYELEQVCIPVGCVPSAAVAVVGVSARGGGGCCLHTGGVCPGGCLPACTGQGWCLPQCRLGYTLPLPIGQNSWHTLVKTLPFHNYVVDGKN